MQLRQYQYYSHGRSLRKFCEDEGLDYRKFCKYAREHGPGSDAGKQTGSADALPASFVEVPQEVPVEPVAIREIRVRFTDGMALHGRADRLEDRMTSSERITPRLVQLNLVLIIAPFCGRTCQFRPFVLLEGRF